MRLEIAIHVPIYSDSTPPWSTSLPSKNFAISGQRSANSGRLIIVPEGQKVGSAAIYSVTKKFQKTISNNSLESKTFLQSTKQAKTWLP